MSKIKGLIPYLVIVLAGAAALIAFIQGQVPSGILALAAALLQLYTITKRDDTCDAFQVWEDAFATGFRDIDQDHKKLLNLINNLQASVLCNTGEAFERQTLNELADYTEFHFQREEKLMEELNYINYEGHKAQHDQMILKVRRFVREYDEKGRGSLKEVADYLKLWLIQHINGTDQQYVAFFKEKGVE